MHLKSILLILLFTIAAICQADTISIADAKQKAWIASVITGRSGHWGECMQLEVRNNHDRPLHIMLEAGRMMIPEDTAVQNMLVTKTEYIYLEPLENKTMPFYAMCAKRFRNAPGTESTFQIGKMAAPELVDLSRMIDKRGYQNTAAQHAVWALTDAQRIEDIYHDKEKVMDSLKQYVARVKGIEVPWYSFIYAMEKPFPEVNELQTVIGNVSYYLPNNAMVSIKLYDQTGKVVHQFAKNVAHHAEHYGYYFELDVRQMPKELYYLTVEADNQVIKKLWMDLRAAPLTTPQRKLPKDGSPLRNIIEEMNK